MFSIIGLNYTKCLRLLQKTDDLFRPIRLWHHSLHVDLPFQPPNIVVISFILPQRKEVIAAMLLWACAIFSRNCFCAVFSSRPCKRGERLQIEFSATVTLSYNQECSVSAHEDVPRIFHLMRILLETNYTIQCLIYIPM